MRRLTLFALLVPLLISAGGAAEDVRWVSYITAPRNEFIGELHVVRSDGEAERTIVDEGVLSTDVGPGGVVYAAVETGEPGEDETLPPSELVRADAEDGDPEPAIPADDAYYLAVAASADGQLAFLRDVTHVPDIPEHLQPVIDTLRQTALPVLAPRREPPDTGGVVADAEDEFYHLRFTNDPDDELSHAEQVNRFVEASTEATEPFGPTTTTEVRGRNGTFSCGASSCFLTWREHGTYYTVGEFGDPEEAAAFAEDLRPMERLAGPFWHREEGAPLPELIVRTPEGNHETLESVEQFCECAFAPVAYNANGKRLLVITSAEGYTELRQYRTDVSRPSRRITEGSVFEGAEILDAGFGPQGILVLVGGEGGPPGLLQTLDGQSVVPGRVRAFDVEGNTLAYVTGRGEVRVRDLSSGSERTIGSGAIKVSLAPDTITQPGPEPEPIATEEGFPILLAVLIGVAALATISGIVLLIIARRRRNARR